MGERLGVSKDLSRPGICTEEKGPSLDRSEAYWRPNPLHVNRVLAQLGRTCEARLGAPSSCHMRGNPPSGRGAAPLESRSNG